MSNDYKLTRKTISGEMERKLVTNCIINTKVLGSVSKVWKPEYAKTPFSKTVIHWCLEHHKAYGKAPQEHITDLYLAYKSTIEEGVADSIGVFLQSLNDDYEDTLQNVDYVVDSTINYIRQRAVEAFTEQLKLAVEHNDTLEAERLIGSFSKPIGTSHDTVDFNALTHHDISEAFDVTQNTLFKLPGALGHMIGDVKATDFVHILSPAKMGKSFFMQWMGIHAMIQGCNVLELSFEVPKLQRIRRWWQAVNCSPAIDKKVPMTYFYKDKAGEKFKVGTKDEHRKAVEYSDEAVENFFKEYKQMYPKGNYRLQCHISKSKTVRDIRNMLLDMAVYENYTPDVLILDHPALLNYGGRGQQGWESMGDLYAELRGIATEFNLALVTASHSTRNSYRATVIDETHTGKSIDILAHITTGISITSTKTEKDAGIYRASQLVEREGRTIADQVIITACLDLALPHTDSRFLSECDYALPVNKDDSDEKAH